MSLGKKSWTGELKRGFTRLWKRTNDAFGHRPLFEIKCVHCGADMFMRWSEIHPDKETGEFGLHDMSWKCPVCDWWILFQPVDTKEYMEKVFNEYRGGNAKLIPVHEWEEDAEIKKKLESLGYV